MCLMLVSNWGRDKSKFMFTFKFISSIGIKLPSATTSVRTNRRRTKKNHTHTRYQWIKWCVCDCISAFLSLLHQNSSNIVSVIVQQTTKSNQIESNHCYFVHRIRYLFRFINWIYLHRNRSSIDMRSNNHIISYHSKSNRIKYLISLTLSISVM